MPATTAAIDYAHLRTQAAANTDVMREVMQLFLVQTEELVAALETTTDGKTWRELTHTLKGSARGVGAFALADAAARAEAAMLDRSSLEPLREALSAAQLFVSENPL